MWKFVASTTLTAKQHFVDLSSVTADAKYKLGDSEMSMDEPGEGKSSGEISPSKGFGIGMPKIGISWKTKPGKKELGDDKNEEDVIVPEEELGVESENLEIDPDVKSTDETNQKSDKNWKFGLPSFRIGRRSTSTQEKENVNEEETQDDQEVSKTLPADIDVPEEDDSQKKKYIVKVKTSDKFTAGTSSDVYIYLYGENGDSSKFF